MNRPGHWPSPEALLLLRSALADDATAARSWARLTATADIDTVDPGAGRLLPLAQRNINRLGLDDPWATRIQGVHRYWWAHNQLLRRQAEIALSALADAGLDTIVLKGLAVGSVHYADVGLRPMSDFDVLVRPADVERALQRLARIRWLPEKRVDETYVSLMHGVSLHDADGHTLDLHWAIHEDDVRPGSDDGAWSRRVTLRLGSASSAMLGPADLLLHAISSGAKWAGDPAVRWVADSVLIIRRGDVDWETFVAESAQRRFVVRARACLSYLTAVLDVPVPSDVMAQLNHAHAPFWERFEHQARVGELPRYWFDWRRTASVVGRRPASFPAYLRCAWDVPSVADVPLAAARRAAYRLATGAPMADRTTSQ